MTPEQAAFLLSHALPPDARKPKWQRAFAGSHRRELTGLDVSTAQVERLERILPAIACYAATGPRLADARAPLVKVGADADKAAKSLRVMLEGAADAMQESRLRFLQAIEALHPERTMVDPQRAGRTFHTYDHREPEALRLLAALQDVVRAAQHAVERMPAEQTRKVAHHYPVALIEAALSLDGPQFNVSASPASRFFDVVTACYGAAGQGEPLRAVRAYLQHRNSSPEK